MLQDYMARRTCFREQHHTIAQTRITHTNVQLAVNSQPGCYFMRNFLFVNVTLCLGTNLLRVESIELNQTLRKYSLYGYLSFKKAILKTNRRIKSTKPTKHQKSDRIMEVMGRQTTTAPVCATSSKLST